MYIFGRRIGNFLGSASFDFSVSLILQSVHENASETNAQIRNN